MTDGTRLIYSRERYATENAIDAALGRGFDLSLRDWRCVFLAITDRMATDGVTGAPDDVSAEYIGNTRSSERWRITWRGRRFDVLYAAPMIVGVVDPRGTAGAAVSMPRPRGGPREAAAAVV